MIQDIFPHIYHNEYQDIQPKENDFILIFDKSNVLVRFQEGKLRYPTRSEMGKADLMPFRRLSCSGPAPFMRSYTLS